MIYFIKGWHIREFGFPRVEDIKKVYMWKKMNFTTDLPKNDPICTYLVSSSQVKVMLLPWFRFGGFLTLSFGRFAHEGNGFEGFFFATHASVK